MPGLPANCTAFLLAGITALGCTPNSLAGSLDVRPYPIVPREASGARVDTYEALERLAGEWVLVEDGKRTPATFELAAGGGALVQKSGFLAVFYPAGDRVAVSYFPDAGYQERLRCDDKPAANGALDLTFQRIDATNVKTGTATSPGFSIHVDADGARMLQTWRFIDAAEKETKLALVFERAR